MVNWPEYQNYNIFKYEWNLEMKSFFIGCALAFMMFITSMQVITTAQANDFKIGNIEIKQPWARASATKKAKAGGAFLSLHNMGKKLDILLSASSPIAKKSEIHGHKMDDNGMMKMYEYGPLTIPAKSMVELKPGGLHIMLMKLKSPLIEGKKIPITLNFKHAGDITIMVDINKVGAMGNMKMKNMGHQNMNSSN